MYESYWGLTASPFRNELDERWFYAGLMHEEALARLYYVVEQRRRCAVLRGAAGTGKSLLLRMLARELRRTQRQSACVDLNGLGGEALLWACAAALDVARGELDAPGRLWRRIEDQLAVLRLSRMPTVLLLDRFDTAGGDALAVVQRLLGLAQGPSCWLTVIAATRAPGSAAHSPAVTDAAELTIDVGPWTPGETAGYVHEAMSKAEAKGEIFTAGALRALFEESHGVPRSVNRLCDLSLLAAMGEGRQAVDADTVHGVAAELLPAGHPQTQRPTVPAVGAC